MSSDERVLCDACGAGCPGDANTCVRCGASLEPKPERIQPVAGKVVGVLVFLAIGIAAESLLFMFMSWAKESPNWPTVTGEITAVSTGRRSGRRKSSPHVKFAWSVDGVDYSGGRYTYRQLGHMKGSFRSYSRGQAVTVYYKPDNPKIAVLRPGLAMRDYAIVGVATFAIFFLIPFWQIFVIMKTRARNYELMRTGRITTS